MSEEDDKLARVEQPRDVNAWDETLRALGYDELRTWVLGRVSAGKRESMILGALSQQLDACADLRKTPERLDIAMKQAKHMQGEIFALRGEAKPEGASSVPTPAEVRAAIVELEQMEVLLFQLKDRVDEFGTRFERAFRVLGKLAP